MRGSVDLVRDGVCIGLYEKGLTLREIGEIYGITRERVRQLLERQGVQRRGQTVSEKMLESVRLTSEKTRVRLPHKELRDLYVKKRTSATEIAKMYGVSPPIVYRNLREAGIPVRSASDCRRIQYGTIDITFEELYDRYVLQDMTQPKLAELYGLSKIGIAAMLKRFKIRKRRQYKYMTKGRSRSKR